MAVLPLTMMPLGLGVSLTLYVFIIYAMGTTSLPASYWDVHHVVCAYHADHKSCSCLVSWIMDDYDSLQRYSFLGRNDCHPLSEARIDVISLIATLLIHTFCYTISNTNNSWIWYVQRVATYFWPSTSMYMMYTESKSSAAFYTNCWHGAYKYHHSLQPCTCTRHTWYLQS